MLESALKFQKAFDLLYAQDKTYRAELAKHDGQPTDDDWDCIRNLVTFLKIFYEATLRMSGSLFVTGNLYLQEILGVGVLISANCESATDSKLRKMALSMRKKQEKYWGNIDNINIMLFISVLLDPRRKWKYLEWVIGKSYDTQTAYELRERVKDTLNAMFASYVALYSPPTQAPTSTNNEVRHIDLTEVDDVQSFMDLEFEKAHGHATSDEKSELDVYLLEEREKTGLKTFDILDWGERMLQDFRLFLGWLEMRLQCLYRQLRLNQLLVLVVEFSICFEVL